MYALRAYNSKSILEKIYWELKKVVTILEKIYRELKKF